MNNRIVLGKRSATEFGIFISKPGQPVLTCPDNQLLMSTKAQTVQVYYRGIATIADGTSSVNVTIPSTGFIPVTLYSYSGLDHETRFIVGYATTNTNLLFECRTLGMDLVNASNDIPVYYSVMSVSI